jgi:hypothetical protein
LTDILPEKLDLVEFLVKRITPGAWPGGKKEEFFPQ